MDDTTLQQALTVVEIKLRIAEQKLKHNHHVHHDLEESMKRLVEYLPVVESARREVRERHDELMEELRRLMLRTVGMCDVLLQERQAAHGSLSPVGPFELDGAGSESGHPVQASAGTVAREPATTPGIRLADAHRDAAVCHALGDVKPAGSLADPRRSGIFSPTSVWRTSSIAERIQQTGVVVSNVSTSNAAATGSMKNHEATDASTEFAYTSPTLMTTPSTPKRQASVR
ncbi:hypothetical protein LTR53_009554 [Teratosphaeriaceae sp. CCFEE 6253]|nr:hypothetical protein LTR53_009554 [Teratosphaeriaceae sp. CCFEE 6253]